MRRKLARGHRLVGGPRERVSRPASDSIDLLPLQGRNEPWPLDGVGAAVAKLALIIVTPGVHFTLLTNKYYSDNVFTFGRNVLEGLSYNLNLNRMRKNLLFFQSVVDWDIHMFCNFYLMNNC